MSDSREKTMRLTRIALLIAMNCISAYLIIPLPFFPVADSLADAHRQPGRLPAAAERRSHHHAGLYRHRPHRRPRLHRRYGRTWQDVRPDRWLHLGLRRCGLPHVLDCKGKDYSFRRYALVAVVIGIPVIYLGGVLQLKGVTGMPWEAAIMSGVVPFIPLDIVKSLCAAALARPLLALDLKRTQG